MSENIASDGTFSAGVLISEIEGADFDLISEALSVSPHYQHNPRVRQLRATMSTIGLMLGDLTGAVIGAAPESASEQLVLNELVSLLALEL
jgi:hypothetical protein